MINFPQASISRHISCYFGMGLNESLFNALKVLLQAFAQKIRSFSIIMTYKHVNSLIWLEISIFVIVMFLYLDSKMKIIGYNKSLDALYISGQFSNKSHFDF